MSNEGGVFKAYDGETGDVISSSAAFDTAMAALIAAIGSNPAHVLLGPGTFTTAGGIAVSSSDLIIEGSGPGVTEIAADSGTGVDTVGIFEHDVTQTGTPHAITVDATAGDLTLTMSAANSANYAAGDYIILYSSLGIDTEFTGRNQGEIHKLSAVDTGTGVLTIDGEGIFETTLISDTARVAKLTMAENFTLKNLTITDLASSRPSTHPGPVLIRFVKNVLVENVQVKDAYNTGIQASQCWGVKVINCDLLNMKDVTPSANVYYGVAAKGATRDMIVSGCTFDKMRHGFVQGAGNATYFAGKTRNVTVVGCTSSRSITAHFDAHQACVGLTFDGNTCLGDDGGSNGIQTRSPATITGNVCIGIHGRGVSLFGGAHGSIVTGNDLRECTDGIYVDKGTNKHVISGNQIHHGTRGGQLARQTVAVSSISNASPAVVTYPDHTLTPTTRVRLTSSGTLPTGLSLNTDYFIISSGIAKDSFQLSLTEGGAAVNTSGAGSGTHSVTIYSGDDTIIANNQIHDNSSYGFGMNGQRRVKVNDNSFRKNSLPFQITDTDSCVDSWDIQDNTSSSHSSTDLPTLAGTNHIIKNNQGFGTYERVSVKTQADSPITLTAGDSGKQYTNEGATGMVTFNLPAAAVGLFFPFRVQDADGITVVADTGDTIRLSDVVSASAGSAVSTTIGSVMTLEAINSTEWVARSFEGSWVVT